MTPIEIALLILGIVLIVALLVWLISRTKGSSIDSGNFGAFTDLSITTMVDSVSDWSGDGGGFSGGGSSGSFDFDFSDD